MSYAYKPEKDFKDLKAPKRNAFGWFVRARDASVENLWFLATDGTLRVRDKSTGFFFKTELEAHHAAVFYYDYHCEEYPHGVVMMASVEPVNEFESQIMRFT